jgi:nitrite reductase/ring-hydroxylating ferredoxin subunit
MSDDGWLTVASMQSLPEGTPRGALAGGVELVLVRRGERVYALSGRCPHRSARLAEHGELDGDLLVCCKHGWDFRLDTGAPPHGEPGSDESLQPFAVQLGERGEVRVREEELQRYLAANPSVFHDDEQVA